MSRLPDRSTVKVPAVVIWFWSTKVLTTAFGESTSDYLVHRLTPVVAVLLGFAAFGGALALQLRARYYVAWRYWLAVSMIGVFGTMAADVLHVGLGVPYLASAALFLVTLFAVFALWQRTEGTVSVHSVDTTRRELYYWSAVVATFALGTAVGDLAASTGGLGYLAAAGVFGGLILLPALGYRLGALSGVVAFWVSYVLTRPVGATVADWLGKPRSAGGVAVGPGVVAGVLGILIVASVAYLSWSGADRPLRLRATEPGSAQAIAAQGTTARATTTRATTTRATTARATEAMNRREADGTARP